MEIYDTKREIDKLELAAGILKDFGGHFVAYNTKFLGVSQNDNFRIKGRSTHDAEELDEICFGYDGKYRQLHLLHVYQMKSGLKFATTEIVMGLNAYWSVSLDK